MDNTLTFAAMKSSMYYLAALTAFIIWGLFSFVLKPLDGYASLDILFYRVFLCSALMLVISLLFRGRVLRQNRQLFLQMTRRRQWQVVAITLAGGLLLTANWFFFIYVMNHISVKAASFAYLICPIMTTVLAFFFLNEKLSRWQWLAVVLSLVSCALLGFNHLMDMLYSLIIALSYALYLVTQRRNPDMDKFLLLTVQIAFSALLLLPFYPVCSGPLPQEHVFYILILVIATCYTILPLFLNLFALQKVNSSTMGILLYINPLINFALAVFYYKEAVNLQQIVSYSIILLSILIFNERHLFRRAARG